MSDRTIAELIFDETRIKQIQSFGKERWFFTFDKFGLKTTENRFEYPHMLYRYINNYISHETLVKIANEKKKTMLCRMDKIISQSLISLLSEKDLKHLIHQNTELINICMGRRSNNQYLKWKLKPKIMGESKNRLTITLDNKIELNINIALEKTYGIECPISPKNSYIAIEAIREYINEGTLPGHEEFVILQPSKYTCGVYTEDEDFIYVLNQDQNKTQRKYCVVEKFDKKAWKKNSRIFFYSSPIEKLLMEG